VPLRPGNSRQSCHLCKPNNIAPSCRAPCRMLAQVDVVAAHARAACALARCLAHRLTHSALLRSARAAAPVRGGRGSSGAPGSSPSCWHLALMGALLTITGAELKDVLPVAGAVLKDSLPEGLLSVASVASLACPRSGDRGQGCMQTHRSESGLPYTCVSPSEGAVAQSNKRSYVMRIRHKVSTVAFAGRALHARTGPSHPGAAPQGRIAAPQGLWPDHSLASAP